MNNQNNMSVLNVSQLVPFSLGNSREKHNAQSRNNLTASIKEAGGVLQPILVRPSPNEDKFEVVAGFGRWQACIELGFEVPVLIKSMTDSEAYEAQLIENLVRDDLTIVDEAKAAQKFITMYSGDYTAAAERLGWTQKKLNDRVQLLRCSEKILEALNQDKIKIGHAVILSSFSEKLQSGTLDKIISENWSVQYLKERAGKAKKFLHTAKFDTTECSSCPHNTSHQIGMFDFNSSDKAACAKLACWNKKTELWLQDAKKVAEDKFGKVLLLVECSDSDRNTVSASTVGEEQFNQGCANCESNVVVMDDRYGKEGQTIESQCLNKVCFTRVVKAHNQQGKTIEIADKDAASHKEQVDKEKGTVAAKSVSANAKPIEQKTPNAVLELEKKLIHSEAQKIFSTETWYINGIVLASLAITTGHKPDFFKTTNDFNENVISCKDIESDRIQKEITHAIEKSVSVEANTVDNRFVYNQQKLMISALATLDNASEILTSAWKPSKALLQNYTGQGIKGLCSSSGFEEAFNECESNKSNKVTFAKIAAKSKSDFIKSILAFDYNWSAFAPETVFQHLK